MFALCAFVILRTASASSMNYSDTFLPPLESPRGRDGGGGSQCVCWGGALDELEVDCRCAGDQLFEIPTNLTAAVKRLTVAEAAMTTLSSEALRPFAASLTDFSMTDMRRLTEIQPGVFNELTALSTIYIHGAPLLKHIHPALFDVVLSSLKILRIVHTGITTVPYLNNLRTEDHLHMVDFENNQITSIRSGEVQLKAAQLSFNYNALEQLESRAFNNSQIAKLTLKGNINLGWLHEDCFQGIQSLRHLDLSKTAISKLPTNGLQELEVLHLEDTKSLKAFPSVYNFKYIIDVHLTYPYHCCAFTFPATHHPEEFAKHQLFLAEVNKNCSLEKGLWDHSTFGSEGVFHEGHVTVRPGRVHALCGTLTKNYRDVRCEPSPDAFNPCEDLMGNWALRVAVWLVAVAALMGNTTVLLVLGSSRFRMTVPKFLMCHLAVADFCMGLYLLAIAAMDARSIGDYFNHAIDWQNGIGCRVAGSLTVFARELSIFTLTVITIERWYTITYAMHLDKRLTLPVACRVMLCGWLYAVGMAVCPLVGISGYSKTSICLPLESGQTSALAYLVVLLTVNGLAFCVVCACYSRMYCAIRGGQETVAALARSDMTVAKRMALLVFTDFACWAPIAFFGITALAGYPLIDVSKTKILLVFFYPLNSCANPYLYALLTQQYRRDLFVLLSRYGLCADAAARYKGTQTSARLGLNRYRGQSSPGPNASVQTTTTSAELLHHSRLPVLKTHTELVPVAVSNEALSFRVPLATGYL